MSRHNRERRRLRAEAKRLARVGELLRLRKAGVDPRTVRPPEKPKDLRHWGYPDPEATGSGPVPKRPDKPWWVQGVVDRSISVL